MMITRTPKRRFLAGLTWSIVVGAVAVVQVTRQESAPATVPVAAQTRPNFQLPFPCDEEWEAKTYNGHARGKIDWYPTAAPIEGRKVVASASGLAVRVNLPGSTGGNQVAIDHGNGWVTLHLHLMDETEDEFSLRKPRKVRAGEEIARVGNTGSNTRGAHLHYEQISGSGLLPNGEVKYGIIEEPVFDGETLSITTDHPRKLTSRNCPVPPWLGGVVTR